MGASIVFDNALLFSAANFVARGNRNLLVRNVNILGLSGLVDAIIMHQRIIVDKRGWDYFCESVPYYWLPGIQPYVDIIDVTLPNMDDVISSIMSFDECISICYALSQFDAMEISSDKRIALNSLYFSYTGHDLGHYDEQKMIEIINKNLAKKIPGIHFYLRTSEHISTLQCLVRGIQYEIFSSIHNAAYLSHEFRGRLLNIFNRCRADNEYRSLWHRLLKEITSIIDRDYNEKIQWTGDLTKPSNDIWKKFEMPLFLSMALQKSGSEKDLFYEVAAIRDKALPLRQIIEEITNDPLNSSENFRELHAMSFEIFNSFPKNNNTVFSFSAAVPISASLGFDFQLQNRKSLKFIRDIYDNHSIPLTLAEDIKRVFNISDLQNLVQYSLHPRIGKNNILDVMVPGIVDALEKDPTLR